MCGISGYISKSNELVGRDILAQMNNVIKHRGPDGEGIYIHKNLGLGHRRLAIIDLSKNGQQPMHFGENVVIVFNGEIYNYLEIKALLIKLGYQFNTSSDTEVILASYQEWGFNCVQKFNGMWAFSIFDKKKNLVFASRDRFGIKPFYYHNSGKMFAWGSELRQFLNFSNCTANKQILFDYLFTEFIHHSEKTFIGDVLSLPAGNNLIYDLNNHSFRIAKYYNLVVNDDHATLSLNDAIDTFSGLMENAISLRLRSDVKVGTCLSGGLDSSYIAAVASRLYSRKSKNQFTAITAKSIDKKTDESDFARMVAESNNLDWHLSEVQTHTFLDNLKKVINVQEEPFGTPSVFMQYFVMGLAANSGAIVMLDGQGGDETFLGYERYYSNYIGFANPFEMFRKAKMISMNSRLTLKEVLLYKFYFNNSILRSLRLKNKSKLFKDEFHGFFNDDLISEANLNQKDKRKFQYNEITKYQLPKLLRFEDRSSMAHSIEARVPFVDHNVVEFGYSIPFEYKIHNGWTKYLIRKASEKNLPHSIAWRKEKFGFESPTSIWMKNRSQFENIVNKSSFTRSLLKGGRINGMTNLNSLWKLVNVALWAEEFNITLD